MRSIDLYPRERTNPIYAIDASAGHRTQPMANAICERVIGTIRRECLDWLIPLSESHLLHREYFPGAHLHVTKVLWTTGSRCTQRPTTPNAHRFACGRREILAAVLQASCETSWRKRWNCPGSFWFIGFRSETCLLSFCGTRKPRLPD
jgi:hypothetical protein